MDRPDLPNIEVLKQLLLEVRGGYLKQKAYERLSQLGKHPEEDPELFAKLEELRKKVKGSDKEELAKAQYERWYAWVGGRTDDELWMGIVIHWEQCRKEIAELV